MSSGEHARPLLSVRDLRVGFDTPAGPVQAVGGVSFDLLAGETLGLVGESGSGKSVSALALLGLVSSPAGRIEGGRILYEGRDLLALPESHLRKLRGEAIAMIFQDPMTSLNPFMEVGEQLSEVLVLKRGLSRHEARTAAAIGLGEVGIPDPEHLLRAHPHELSGGMRQRVMIAMALLCRPRILIADEPTTALDVTIQAQILELLQGLQERHGTAILFITHDLGVVAGMADRLGVMYAGEIVEIGGTGELFATPAHPYTRGLLEAVPRLDHDPASRLPTIEGQPPVRTGALRGCAFAPRCPYRETRCESERPRLEAIEPEQTRASACFARLRVKDGPPASGLSPRPRGAER